jgi:hypothetical protein
VWTRASKPRLRRLASASAAGHEKGSRHAGDNPEVPLGHVRISDVMHTGILTTDPETSLRVSRG